MMTLADPPAAPLRRPAGFQWLREVDRLLRGDATQPAALRAGNLEVTSDRLQLAIVALGMGYGLCMGVYALLRGESWALLQLISGMVKVPALFLLTLLVTFPSLYVFNALVGSRLSVSALWRLLTSSVALNMAVLASMGPIVAFFSLSTTSYSFMLLLNVFVFSVAGILGLKFLLQTLHRLTISQDTTESEPPLIATPPRATQGPLDRSGGHARERQVKLVFGFWMIAFALVGAQMSWVLRPFLGSPDRAFSFLRARESNFFEAVWQHLTHLLGG
ncbi:MAG: hypothetical protein U1G07_12755 [Verrucomicrobiota bacterium]